MIIFARTLTGITIQIPNFNPNDTVKEFKKKCLNEIDRLNAPAQIEHELARKKMIINLYLIRERIINRNYLDIPTSQGLKLVGFFKRLCLKEIWDKIFSMALPLNDVEKPIVPFYPFSTKNNNFRIVVCGREPQDDEKCLDWVLNTVIHIIVMEK